MFFYIQKESTLAIIHTQIQLKFDFARPSLELSEDPKVGADPATLSLDVSHVYEIILKLQFNCYLKKKQLFWPAARRKILGFGSLLTVGNMVGEQSGIFSWSRKKKRVPKSRF